ncbi:POT family MFS transporter [Mucilaginibacter robiniae]|uniref:POT family MFS transporter n=1 Tax=Mucilaginibacter robiniae TaxID=2728022 RepID=A0A7L5DUJ0_9SPHI|nr:MFS transporter [Mucilaginibacter robiniae]QJD94371.1 POT family MFS transporter [Mucilaginibacter robiniae]
MQEIIDTPVKSTAKIPRSVPFIIGNEFAERFSFYGMRSIIAVFLVHQFFNHETIEVANAKANAINHAFSTLVYFTPLLGAILADWFFGKYRVILIGSLVYTIGHFILSMFDTSLSGFVTGLIVIAFSAGAIKSCVSANVGDQFDHKNQHLMSSIYGWFYFSINAGSMISLLLIPLIYDKAGAAWAFGVPGILMALATLIFFLGSKSYVKLPPGGIKKDNFVTVNFYTLSAFFAKKDKSKTAWQQAEAKYGIEKVEAIKAVWGVIAVFAFIPIFWGMWDMNGSEWILQAEKLNLGLGIFNMHILPSQIQFVNALFLLLMIPVFNYGIYPLVGKMGIKLTPLKKIGAGLFITGFSFVIIAFLQRSIDAGGHPSVWWQIFAYFMLSAGEVLVSITGLEYAYTQSPPSMKSTMTAIWYLTYSVGTFFTTLINVNISNKGFFAYFTGEKYYWLFVGIMGFFVVLFVLVSPFIKEKVYLVADATLAETDGLNVRGDKTNEIHPDNPIV